MSETTAHLSLVDFLDRTTPRLPALAYVFHTANESAGGAKTKRGIPLDILKEAQMGVRAGVWDFQLILPGVYTGGASGCAIELKSDRAYKTAYHGLSDDQRRWQAYYTLCGWETHVFPESRWHEAALLLVARCGGNPEDYCFS